MIRSEGPAGCSQSSMPPQQVVVLVILLGLANFLHQHQATNRHSTIHILSAQLHRPHEVAVITASHDVAMRNGHFHASKQADGSTSGLLGNSNATRKIFEITCPMEVQIWSRHWSYSSSWSPSCVCSWWLRSALNANAKDPACVTCSRTASCPIDLLPGCQCIMICLFSI